jgi:hypothetical protein
VCGRLEELGEGGKGREIKKEENRFFGSLKMHFLDCLTTCIYIIFFKRSKMGSRALLCCSML